jgi:hypothetical protein
MSEYNKSVSSSPNVPETVDEMVELAKYILSSDIPKSERDKFRQMVMLFNKEYALSNIERFDIPYYQLQFDYVVLAMECGLYRHASETMAQVIQELKLTRGIQGLQLKLGFTGVQRSETVQRIEEHMQKKSLRGKITGIFKNKEKEEENI